MYTRMPIIIVISSLVHHYFSRLQDAMVKGVQGAIGTVLSYTVTISSFASFPGLPLVFEVPLSVCVSRWCVYLFNATGRLLPSSLNVSVAAVSAIGAGPPSSPMEVCKCLL